MFFENTNLNNIWRKFWTDHASQQTNKCLILDQIIFKDNLYESFDWSLILCKDIEELSAVWYPKVVKRSEWLFTWELEKQYTNLSINSSVYLLLAPNKNHSVVCIE